EKQKREAAKPRIFVGIGGTDGKCINRIKILFLAANPLDIPTSNSDLFYSFEKNDEWWKTLYPENLFIIPRGCMYAATGNPTQYPYWNRPFDSTLRCSICNSTAIECRDEEHR